MRFYAKYSSRVEIVSNGKLQTFYFPRYPHCKFMDSEAKDTFNTEVDRTTARSKCQALVRKAEWLEFALKTEFVLTHDIPVFSVFFRHIHIFVTLMFALIFTINILLTIGLTDGNMSNIIERDIIIDPLNADESELLVQVLGYIMIIVFFFIAFKEIVIAFSETIATQRIFVEKSQRKANDNQGNDSSKIDILFKIWYYFKNYFLDAFFQSRVLYHVFLFGFLVFNLVEDTVIGYPVFITYIVYSSSTLRDVTKAVVEPYKEIALTMTLYFALAWIFAVIIFYFFYSDYDEIVNNGCFNLWSCFVTTFDQGYKTGAGPGAAIGKPYSDKGGTDISVKVERFIFDYLVYFILVVLTFSILTGIIIDKFSELRERANNLDEDNRSLCFICDQTSADLDKKDGYGGFVHHIFFDHNKWDYVFFLAYLRDKKSKRQVVMSEIERIVYEKYITDDNSWLPCDWDYSAQEESEVDKIKGMITKLDEKLDRMNEDKE